MEVNGVFDRVCSDDYLLWCIQNGYAVLLTLGTCIYVCY
jgi:hypothetical protein